MSETTVGAIIGYLRLDNDQALRSLAEVNAEVDKLDTARADVTVKADTSDAVTGLAEVAAEADAVDRQNVKVESSSRSAGKGLGLMATSVLTLGPALVPLAAGAVGAGAAFGAMGAAGIAAVFGIKAEMASGSAAGRAFGDAIHVAQDDLLSLSKTAASGVLAPLQQSVLALDAAMPALSTAFGQFATITGKAAALTVQGLLAAFQSLTPMMQTASVYALGLSQRFAEMMSGPGVASFGAYVTSVFPQVMATVESVAQAAIRLVQALAPLGMGTLGMLRTFADLINAIPVNVLSFIAQAATSVFIAFRTWQGLSGVISSVGTALGATAGAMSAMSIAAGGVGIALGLLVAAASVHAESQRKDAAAVQELTDALKQSNGVIDDSVQATLTKQAADAGMADSARRLGLSFADITQAAQGNVDALARVNAGLDAARKSGSEAAAAGGEYASAMVAVEGPINAVSDFIAAQNGHLGQAKQGYQDWTSATAAAKASQDTMAVALHNSALLHDASAASTDADRKALQGLNSEMDKAISKELTLAGAQTAVDSALLSMTEALKTNKGSLDENTQAGIADRQAIEGAAGALQRQRDAAINSGVSTAEATAKYQASGAALLGTIAATNGANSAAYRYAAQLLAIPPSVTTTISTPGLASSYAQIVAYAGTLSAIPSERATIIRTIQTTQNKLDNPRVNPGMAEGGIIRAYAGGGMESHVAQIAPAGAMRLWAEPETGGEAYIPLTPAKRARSLAIWEETGRMLGAQRSGPVIHQSFYIQGASADEVAQRVQAALSFQLAGS